ncbi:MAG TPA: WhiB family transcriptional regulator, partial [Acidimicrobiia bacterium]|nr:WhiB family transcriptional regulator [Acidimicrobiia bacterium]
MVVPEEWMGEAACVGAEAEFFPERGEDASSAKQLCAVCRVRVECLEYALVEEITAGIWGGTSARERRRLR